MRTAVYSTPLSMSRRWRPPPQPSAGTWTQHGWTRWIHVIVGCFLQGGRSNRYWEMSLVFNTIFFSEKYFSFLFTIILHRTKSQNSCLDLQKEKRFVIGQMVKVTEKVPYVRIDRQTEKKYTMHCTRYILKETP